MKGSKAGSGIWVTSPVPWLALPPSENERSLRPGPGTILICGRSKQGKAQRWYFPKPTQITPPHTHTPAVNRIKKARVQSLGSGLGGWKPCRRWNHVLWASEAFPYRPFKQMLLPPAPAGNFQNLEESLWKLRGQMCDHSSIPSQ